MQEIIINIDKQKSVVGFIAYYRFFYTTIKPAKCGL